MQITKEITIETTIDIDPIYRLRCSNSCIHYDAIMGVCGLFGEIINEGGERDENSYVSSIKIRV